MHILFVHMRLHRFFIDQSWTEGPVQIANPDLCHQWSSVLRMKAGDRIIICDGCGAQSEAVIEALTKKSALLDAKAPQKIDAEPNRRITLACAVLKRENFEWVVQKATEAGVATIIPLLTERTVKTGLKQDRLLRIAREAAEQSGRGVIPDISEPVSFEEFLQKSNPSPSPSPRIFFHCGADGDLWVKDMSSANTATCIIGPEGGWSDEEADLAKKHGCIIGSLGSLTLRAETAAVIATYRIVQSI